MESKCERCKLCKPSCTLRWNDDIVRHEYFLGEPTSPNHAVKEIQDDLLSSSIWDDDAMTDTANLSVDLMINKQKPKDKDEAHTQLPNDNVSQVNISQAEPEDTADTTKFELVIKNNQDESIVCRRCKKKMGSGVRCSQCRSTWHWSCGGVKGEDKTDVISASK